MIKSKRLLAVGVIAALGFTAAACGSDDDDSATTDAPAGTEATAGTEAPDGTEAPPTAPPAREAPAGSDAPAGECDAVIGMAFDVTGRGDKSFNDAAGAALDQAVSELGITFEESTPTGEGDRAERLQGLVDSGAGLVQWQRLPVLRLDHVASPRQPRRQLHHRRLGRRGRRTWPRWCSPRSRARSSSVPPRR